MDTLFQSAATRIAAEARTEAATVRNPMAPHDFAHPSITASDTFAGGRGYRDKFAQGFLTGTGSSSQFQATNMQVGDRRGFYNDNTSPLLAGVQASNLLPSWRRSYAFAPGLGLDAIRTKIIWTPDARGDVGGPAVPNYGYLARTGSGGDNDPQADPIVPNDGTFGAGLGVQAPQQGPKVLSTLESANGLESFMKEARAYADGETKRRLAQQRKDAKAALG